MVEEVPTFKTDGLKGPENWVHLPKALLKLGRTEYPPTPAHLSGDEEAATAWLEELTAKDPKAGVLAPLNEDKPVEGRNASWTFKVAGDTQPYKGLGEGENVSYAVNVVESLRWPGAVTVAKNGEWCQIYVGDAVRKGGDCFYPNVPGEVMADPAEPEDQDEPQGDPNEKVPVDGEPVDDE